MILVDANILSEPTKPFPNSKVLAWLKKHEREVVINPIILGEIRFGIHLLPTGKKRRRLEQWFAAGITRIHCLPFDADSGLRWAALVASLRTAGKSVPIKDSLIAATALVHAIPVATHNKQDFIKTGATVINPFTD